MKYRELHVCLESRPFPFSSYDMSLVWDNVARLGLDIGRGELTLE